MWIEKDEITALPEAWVASVLLVQCAFRSLSKGLQLRLSQFTARIFAHGFPQCCTWMSEATFPTLQQGRGNGKERQYMFCSVVKLETRKLVLVWVFFPCSEKNMQMKCEREIILKADRNSITERTGPSRESQIQGTTERNPRKLGLTPPHWLAKVIFQRE